jgi:hypothetical protein
MINTVSTLNARSAVGLLRNAQLWIGGERVGKTDRRLSISDRCVCGIQSGDARRSPEPAA